MAPRTTAQRRSQSQNEHIYDLGVRGRKTGVFLKDTGVRDEHGMQPLDDLFSSPEKENRRVVEVEKENLRVIEDDSEESDEEEIEMDIDETTGPAPSAFMNARNGVQLPIPRGRSPPKTFLQSPAIKNPALGPSSSPARGSVVHPRGPSSSQTVKRRLDFGMQSLSAAKPTANGTKRFGEKPNGVTNGHQSQEDEDDESDNASLPANDDESMAIIDAGVDDYIDNDVQGPEEEDEPEEEEEEEEVDLAPKPAAGRKGRPKKNALPEEPEEDQEPEPTVEQEPTPDESDEPIRAGRKRGRPAKGKGVQDDDATEKPTKRRRSGGEESDAASAKEAKRGPTGKAGRPRVAGSDVEAESSKPSKAIKKATTAQKAKRGRKRESPAVGEASFVEPPRGPPPPKSRGLMIMRRETPGAAPGIFQTRSGRTSYKPLAFWKNEHVEHDGGDILEDGKAHIFLPKIKEIVRVEEQEDDRPTKRKGRAGRAPGKKSKRITSDEESEEEVEPWEEDPGVVTGEVIVWNPDHEFNPPAMDDEVEVVEEQVAIAGSAIETRDIRNAKFRFAKTLSMPFFGSGVVDMPPGSIKRPKNSRKMHMTFFVYTGRVKVSVGETEFRIKNGGMWFVPRGNYYSIENDYDQHARIFFAQGCEVTANPGQAELSMLG
ncbi:putative cupin domain-containing protein [Phaeoacremonium minimum UCRPA7]|uniref:CENP-C homolog n=1 Tax=Phaeoacremonium minimum (strain UCR-PA7) TaxID=1286976 RepID=R8BW83_PHAM7|nr:putative cupin domain-containing protein [Phaeoacremonium minimum UCRPA7]EOO03597.1 putative cupin domain-containing protein [Phaeoacremonium minimum UCRPA7]